jgi:hypothetical protein
MDGHTWRQRNSRSWWRIGCISIVMVCLLGGSVVAGVVTPAAASVPSGQSQVDQPFPNTLTIRSTGDERVSYTITVSERIRPGSGADLSNATQPDAVSQTTASGSTAQGGVDNFTFSGRITVLDLSGDSAEVTVNGEQVDPTTFPQSTSTPVNTTTPPSTPADTPPAPPTVSSTPTPSPTTTTTSIPTSTQGPTSPQVSRSIPTSTPTATSPSTAIPSPTQQPTTAAGTTVKSTPATKETNITETQTRSKNESGVLGLLNSVSVFSLVGGFLMIVFTMLAVVARYNR